MGKDNTIQNLENGGGIKISQMFEIIVGSKTV